MLISLLANLTAAEGIGGGTPRIPMSTRGRRVRQLGNRGNISRNTLGNYISTVPHVTSYHVGHFEDAMWSSSSRGVTLPASVPCLLFLRRTICLLHTITFSTTARPPANTTTTTTLWSDTLLNYSYYILRLLPTNLRGPGLCQDKSKY